MNDSHLLRCETCEKYSRFSKHPCNAIEPDRAKVLYELTSVIGCASHSSTTSAAKATPSDAPGCDEPLRTEKVLVTLVDWIDDIINCGQTFVDESKTPGAYMGYLSQIALLESIKKKIAELQQERERR